MNAVVLAGGVRSGLEIPGSGLPRALWPFPKEPLVSHVVRFLMKGGCGEISICANGKTRMIAAELSGGATPWVGLHFSEDPLPRGPAGCLRDLKEWVGGETLVCIQGTGWYDFDLGSMVAEHQMRGAAVTVGARERLDGTLEPAGVYLVEPETLDLISAVGYQDIKEQFLPKVLAAGKRVQCHKISGRAILIHSPEHYLGAMGEAILRAELPAGFVRRQGGAVVHETAEIGEDVKLSGAVWVDAGAVIEDGAMVAGAAVVGEGAWVGKGAMVRRAVLMREARVEAGAEVFATVIGPRAVKGASRSFGGRAMGERGWTMRGGRGMSDVAAEMMHAKA